MNKSLYFIECTCIRDCKFPNVEYHKGEVVYFNPKAASNETYIYCWGDEDKNKLSEKTKNNYGPLISAGHLPFTRQKKFAKKWQIKRYAENNAYWVEKCGDFKCTIKEIKLTYTEEEI